jgi:Protein of unknown function (DUF2956)
MPKQKKLSFQAQAEQLTKEEALRIAKGTQAPGQTKEQTKLIAKGIEKGIALYRKKEKEKARERAKLRRKRDKPPTGEAIGTADSARAPDNAHFAAKHRTTVPLAVAGVIFFLVSAAHLTRYFVGLDLIVGTFSTPETWSLAAGVVSALLAVWMFWSLQGRASGKK